MQANTKALHYPGEDVQVAAMKDGLPKASYAYTPTDKPDDWKLPYLTASGDPDPDHLPGAVASLTNFRGQKVDIPDSSLPMVKSKLRQAYRKWQGTDVKYPASIAEAGDIPSYVGTCLACNDPNDCGCDSCSCDASTHINPSVVTVGKALDALGDLASMLDDEAKEPDQAKNIQAAIDAVLKFVPQEMGEITAPDGDDVHESDLDKAIAIIREAGARNSKVDMARLKSVHDLTHELGVNHPPYEDNTSMPPTYMQESFAVDTKAKPKEIVFAESGSESLFVTLAEAEPVFDDAKKQVWITPIKPGFGNSRDGFYYPTSTLREATEAGHFTGLKMFRNHPRKSDEKELPERSVTDWFAVLNEARWDSSKNAPRALMQVFNDEDWAKMKAAPEHVAFSVRGGGMARPGQAEGKDARIVESLTNLKSVDWVTQAGAGGAISFAESANDEEFDMSDIDKLTADQLKAANPALYAELTGVKEAAAVAEPPEKTEDKVGAKVEDVKVEKIEASTTALPADDAPKSDEKTADDPQSVLLARLKKLEDAETARVDAAAKETKAGEAKKVVEEDVKESTLPTFVKTQLIAKFSPIAESGVFDQAEIKAQIAAEIDWAGKLLRQPARSKVTGLGGDPGKDGEVSVRESVGARLAARWGDEKIVKADTSKEDKGDAADLTEGASDEDGRTVVVSDEAKAVEARLAARLGR